MSFRLKFYPCFKINNERRLSIPCALLFQLVFSRTFRRKYFFFLFPGSCILYAQLQPKKYVSNMNETGIQLTVCSIAIHQIFQCTKLFSSIRQIKNYLALKYFIFYIIATYNISDQSFFFETRLIAQTIELFKYVLLLFSKQCFSISSCENMQFLWDSENMPLVQKNKLMLCCKQQRHH